MARYMSLCSHVGVSLFSRSGARGKPCGRNSVLLPVPAPQSMGRALQLSARTTDTIGPPHPPLHPFVSRLSASDCSTEKVTHLRATAVQPTAALTYDAPLRTPEEKRVQGVPTWAVSENSWRFAFAAILWSHRRDQGVGQQGQRGQRRVRMV